MASTQSNPLSPDWLAHRYDQEHDAVHFVHADRSARASATFLTDDHLAGATEPLQVARQDVLFALEYSLRGPVHFIFHSAYCCSTLLANAFEQPGFSYPLKEPVLLNDLVGWRHRGARPEQVGARLDDALALLARPFEEGERCVIKPSNVVNGLAAAMMRLRPNARALLLYAPLRIYLGSIASKGLWGRLWVRDLFLKQRLDNLPGFGFSEQDCFLQTDLQIAAMGWLEQHRLFHDMARLWPDRIRTIDSETLLESPQRSLRALDDLYGIDRSDEQRAATATRVFSHHGKSGEAFDASQRRKAQDQARGAYADEIDKVAIWAEAVATGAGISMTLPSALI